MQDKQKRSDQIPNNNTTTNNLLNRTENRGDSSEIIAQTFAAQSYDQSMNINQITPASNQPQSIAGSIATNGLIGGGGGNQTKIRPNPFI